MLVSQYIFTACGKQKNGDFTVWSKSADITDAEGEEIHQLMTYKNPSGVNLYEASEEEIKNACPTKYAYFILSTGKKVLAESNFIGRVYSSKTAYGQDTRWGNFFIHAYVFDSLGETFPMSFLNKNKFKCKLDYGEWHDNPCPETLPQIDVQPEPLNFREIEAFFTSERKQNFLYLLQAVINAAENDSSITLIDTEINRALWYTAIGMFLTPSLREKVTFGNQLAAVSNYNMSGGMSGAKTLTIRNNAGSSFYYAANSATSQPVFDFTKNSIATVTVGTYITGLGDALNKSLICALEYVKDIENLCSDYGCNREQAVALFMLKNSKLQWFSSFEDFTVTNDSAEKFGMISAGEAAYNVYRAIFINKQWQSEILSAPILKKIYRHGDKVIKDDLTDYYISHIRNYVTSASDASEYAQSFYASAPFSSTEFLQYLAAKNSFVAGFAGKNDFCWNNLIFVTFLKEYFRLNREKAYAVIQQIFCFYSDEKTYKEINLLLTEVYSVSPELAEKLILDTANGFENTDTHNFIMFYFIESAKSFALQLDILKKIAEANAQSQYFLSEYTRYYNNKPALYSALENELVRDPRFANFKTNRETYAFRMNNNVGRSDLNSYFNKYYLKGLDRGLYFEKLKYFLSHSNNAKNCFEVYSDIRMTDMNFADIKYIFAYIHNKMYEPNAEDILSYPRQETMLMEELDAKLASVGMDINPKSVYIRIARTLLCAEKDEAATLKLIESLKQRNLFASLGGRQIDELVNNYLGTVTNIYLNYRAIQNVNANDDDNLRYDNMRIFVVLFDSLVQSYRFSDEFTKAVAKLNPKNQLILLTDMFILACNYPCPCADEIKFFLKNYISGFPNRKKAERLIGDIISSAPEKCKQNIQIYSEQLGFYDKKEAKNDRNEKKEKKNGFFSQIFGFGKKDKNDD